MPLVAYEMSTSVRARHACVLKMRLQFFETFGCRGLGSTGVGLGVGVYKGNLD
jgi:hypothetical protein